MKEKIFILEKISKKEFKTDDILTSLKRESAKKFGTSCPSHSELLKTYHELVKKKSFKKNKEIENLLRTRKIRSLSGIVVISVLTKFYPCPGKCIFCPSENQVPKSYLKSEPAVMRAIMNKFIPDLQIQSRLRSLEATGHPIDKIELRIIGGTWSFYPKNYQTWFVTRCFRACNVGLNKLKYRKMKSLEEEQKINEKAKQRIVGITIETRPDFITKQEVKRLRKLGVTRVELGVQSLYDDVLVLNQRGHKIAATIKATKFLKDAGFKVCYQMMPNLFGSGFRKDEEMFKRLFFDSRFQPDFLKIYPCSILKKTPLYQLWKRGEYHPYKKEELINLLLQIKKNIPYYCRTQRIIRDIPASDIVEGPTKISNLGEIVVKEAKMQGWKCKCIRCREVRDDYNPQEKLYLFRKDYLASEGKEIFLSFESKKQKKLYGLLRLRISSYIFNNELPVISALKNASIIREIHVYGQLLSLKENDLFISPQHKGLGKKLIKEAEKITKQEFGLNKIAVISGVGVRPYWRKLGYKLEETYMVKKL